ncbi:MAG: hypothetical protein WC415_02545 [Patescibacteria group bacterium]|jgi:hypothetical protein
MPDNKNQDFQSLGALFAVKRAKAPPPPAYQWQELALRVISELGIPPFKKSSVFKACRDHPKDFIEICLNDTKELCTDGQSWKYFFKIIQNRIKEKNNNQ